MPKELETLLNFINSNNSFYNAINNNEEIEVDDNILFESLILYLKLNEDLLWELDSPSRYKIEKILSTNNLSIKNRYIIIDNKHKLSFRNLLEIIEDLNRINRNKRIIRFHTPRNSHNNNQPTTNQINQVYRLKPYEDRLFKNYKERSIFYEKTLKVNKDTKLYIRDTNTKFLSLIEYIINKIINNDLNKVDRDNLLFFYSCLSLYPLTLIQKKYPTLVENLDFPQEEIGLTKSTYEEAEIIQLEKENRNLNNKLRKVNYQKISTGYGRNMPPFQKNFIDNQIRKLEEEIMNNKFEYYLKTRTSNIYNDNLIYYLNQSIISGNVEINKFFEDPLLKFFYIEEDETKFYCAMHLSTFTKLSNDDKIISFIEGAKKYRLEI